MGLDLSASDICIESAKNVGLSCTEYHSPAACMKGSNGWDRVERINTVFSLGKQ